MAELIDLLNIN